MALNYGSVVLISSMTGLNLVFSDILAPALFGETFIWRIDGVVCFILIIGSIICACQTPHKQFNDGIDVSNYAEFLMDLLIGWKMIACIVFLSTW